MSHIVAIEIHLRNIDRLVRQMSDCEAIDTYGQVQTELASIHLLLAISTCLKLPEEEIPA